MHGTNTRASQEGNHGLGNHGQVDGDSVTLLYASLLQGPGNARDLPQELAVGDRAALIRLVGLIDDGNLVGVLQRMAVDTVEGGIETALDEPGIVAVLERAKVGGLEVLVPSEELPSSAGPEGIGAADRLFIELLVFIEVLEVGAGGVLVVECFGNVEGIDLVRFQHLGTVSGAFGTFFSSS